MEIRIQCQIDVVQAPWTDFVVLGGTRLNAPGLGRRSIINTGSGIGKAKAADGSKDKSDVAGSYMRV